MTLNIYDAITDIPTLVEDEALIDAKAIEVNTGEERGGISFLEITLQLKDGRQVIISTGDEGSSYPLAYWATSEDEEED